MEDEGLSTAQSLALMGFAVILFLTCCIAAYWSYSTGSYWILLAALVGLLLSVLIFVAGLLPLTIKTLIDKGIIEDQGKKIREEVRAEIAAERNAKQFQLDYKQFEAMMLKESGVGALGFHPALKKNYQEVFEFFNPKSGWLGTYFREKSSTKQVAIVKNMTDVQKMILEQTLSHAKALQEQRRTAAEFYIFMQQNYAQLEQLKQSIEYNQKAYNQGFLPETFDHVNKVNAETEARIKETTTIEDMRHKHSLEKTEQEVELELKKYKEKVATDLNANIESAKAELEFEIIANHLTGHKQVALIQDLIDIQYIKIDDIRNSNIIPEGAKKDMITARERIIRMYMKQQEEALAKDTNLLQP